MFVAKLYGFCLNIATTIWLQPNKEACISAQGHEGLGPWLLKLYYGKIWINFVQSEVNVTCNSTRLYVYCDIILSQAHKQLSCTKPLPRGISVQWSWYEDFLRAKFCVCFYAIMFCFILAQLYIRGNSWYFIPKHWNWQICHTHWAFKLPLALAVSYELFPRWIDGWIYSQSNPTIYSSSFQKKSSWLTSWKRATKWPLCSLFRGSWLVLRYTVHMNALKIAGSAWQNNLHLVLQICISHHAIIVIRGKDKTEHCC